MNHRYTANLDRNAHDLSNAQILVGKRVAALSNARYYFNGAKDTDDTGDIEWQCDEQLKISMYLLSDGESVGADLLPLAFPASFEIETGSICTWQKENLLASLSAEHLAGNLITNVEGLADTWPDSSCCLVGFKVTFETGDFVVFYNRGDEAAVLINELPLNPSEIRSAWVDSIG